MDLQKIGILSFATQAEGFSGAVKKSPQDFVVQEISAGGEIASLTPDPTLIEHSSEYTDFTLAKTNWDQHIILKKIANRVGVSRKRLHYAGTKDKFAITAQRISAWKLSAQQLASVKIKDCLIGDFSASDKRLELGDLWGNRFSIFVRDVSLSEKELSARLKEFSSELKKLGGIPSFFGEQRFGMRFNNHLIGKELLRGNLELACKHFLTDTIETELPDGKQAREFLAENWGSFSEAISKYPNYMRFERALLNHLIQFPNDFVGAFKKLHKNNYKMFTHAYQSHIFNLELSGRIKSGDLSGEMNLVGYNSDLSGFQLAILEKDGLTKETLRIKSFPEASISGSKRKCIAEIKNFSYLIENNSLKLSFDLEKGSYATVLLHELLKE